MSFTWSSPPGRRRRPLVVRLVLLGALLLVLVVTAVLWPRPEGGALSVATVAGTRPTGALRGDLAAVRSGDHVCYSTTLDGAVSVLRFAPGWSADARLGLRDPSGGVVAQPGDTVVLLGAPGAVGSVSGCAQAGRVWTITAVRSRS